MNVDELPEKVWIGEAYTEEKELAERVVHLTEADAREDIGVLAESCGAAFTTVSEERLHTGQVDSMEEL